jgi:hypothetical protein
MIMADVRCPMCGKSNPVELEVCQYCQARLKPLHVSPSEVGSPAPSQPSGNETQGDEVSPPEWLRSLRLEEEIGELEEPQASDEVPDWSEEGSEVENPPEQPADESAELPDWLTNLRQEGKGTVEEIVVQNTEPEEAESSWGELRAEMPDWLADIRNEEEQGSLLEESESKEPDRADEEPDWLQRIRSRSQDEARSSPARDQEDADRPGAWSTALFQDEETDAGQEEESAATVEPGEIPDWLSDLKEEQEIEPLASGQDWPTEEEQPAADTLSKDDSSGRPPSAAPFDTGTLRALYSEEGESEVPSWMARFSGEEGAGSKADEEVTPASASESTSSPSGDATSEADHEVEDKAGSPELDWLTDIQQAALREQPEEEKPLLFTSSGAISPFMLEEGDEAEEAQATAEATEISDVSSESVSPTAHAEIPDWLAEVAPRESGLGQPDETFEERETSRPSGQEEIAPAELPSWLEAMRPVEFAASKPPPVEEGADRVESVGPLAGLRGVLPAEPDVSRAGKTSGYSIKLQVSDAQQAHASLLDTLVKEEGLARPLPQRSVISPQHLLRLAITVVLIVTAVFPMLMGWPQESPPAFPPEAGAVNFFINNLKTGAPVLVAVDYEPGWSGEMDATSAGVIQHLELKGAYPAFISTVPTGPAQAEHLLATVGQGSGAAWQAGQNYANLGFIPGGAAGLLSFAQSPQKIVPAYSETGKRAWDEGSLVNIQSISDFSLAIVITQNPDTARTWIEQVGPYLGEQTPLLMLLSAQAEPLVRPYYQEFQQQVKGMVVGLVGGASYENLNGQPLLALTYWDSFNLAIIIAVVIIFLGALFNASLAAVGKRKNDTSHEGAQ